MDKSNEKYKHQNNINDNSTKCNFMLHLYTLHQLCIFLSQFELLDCNCPHVLPIPSFVFYENMKNQEIINKRHRIQGGIMFIGGLVFAAVITAYAYNGDNINNDADDILDQEKEEGNGKKLTRRGYR
jgi:hypothetical protein